MATSPDPKTQLTTSPLSEFQKIGHNTYLYTSETFNAKSPLIILFSWNAAAAKHIAKYTASYPRLFPSSRILLIRCDTPDFFRSEPTYQKLLLPAYEVVKEHVQNGGEVLIHSFSNGGANQLVEFSKLWKKREVSVLPSRAQILDSSPGLGGYWKSHRAIYLGLPKTWFFRFFGSVLVHGLLIAIAMFNALTLRKNVMVEMRRQMNGPDLFDQRAPRVYLYSKKDEVVGDEEVAVHADQAQEKGWVVKKVVFESSPHAEHVREDEGRYWGAVMEAWNGNIGTT